MDFCSCSATELCYPFGVVCGFSVLLVYVVVVSCSFFLSLAVLLRFRSDVLLICCMPLARCCFSCPGVGAFACPGGALWGVWCRGGACFGYPGAWGEVLLRRPTCGGLLGCLFGLSARSTQLCPPSRLGGPRGVCGWAPGAFPVTSCLVVFSHVAALAVSS